MIYKGLTKRKKLRAFLLISFLFFTSYLTSKTFKKVYSKDIILFGSDLFTNKDILNNSSLNLPTRLIFVKTKYLERELKKKLSLQNVSVNRQIFPFGLKIIIKTRTPIAYAEKILDGKKIIGFVDENGFFINEQYSDIENMKQLSIRVIGWKENFKETLSKILKSQKNNDVEFLTVNFSPSGFLTLEEKNLKKIFLGINPKIIKTQLQMICDIKNQISDKNLLEKIDNIDLTDPNNPKIKVFKP